MKSRKIVAGLLVVTLLMAGSLSVQAAPKKKAKKPPQPITLEADELYFNDRTGELFAKGNVVITQDKSKIYTDIMRGNDKQTEIWTDGGVHLVEPLTDVKGMKIRYNYGLKFGTMQDIKGKCSDDFITGRSIHFEDGKYTAYDATTTGCPAKKTPDYHVSARKVEIWPEDKMIAYDAKVWIGNTVIYSTPKYKRSLKKNERDTEYPSFGYQDPDGYWIKQHLSFPFTDSVSLDANLYYYTKTGFKPNFELVDGQKDYSFKISYGDYSSTTVLASGTAYGGVSNTVNWVRKAPEFRFDWFAKPIGDLPWKYNFTALAGQWTDNTKTSWHQDYWLYFTRKPIYLDKEKTWTWTNGFGLEHVRESDDNSVQNILTYNTALSKRISPRLTVWTAFNYNSNTQNAFAYNTINVPKEWVNGFHYQLDKKTAFSFYNSYDTVNGRTYENYYTIYRDLHCWSTYVQYQAKAKAWIWNLTVLRF